VIDILAFSTEKRLYIFRLLKYLSVQRTKNIRKIIQPLYNRALKKPYISGQPLVVARMKYFSAANVSTFFGLTKFLAKKMKKLIS
jgi:hypothetical protein